MKNLIDRINADSPSFCPICGTPVSRSIDTDSSRLCEACGWFGDQKETLSTPPQSDEFNPTLAAVQALELFRGQCRRELVLEQAYDAGSVTEADLKSAKIHVRQSTHSLVEMFTALWKKSHDT